MLQTPRVFISYARKDGEAFAADLVRRLEEADIPVWHDRKDIRGGEGWWNQIDRVLDKVEFMVVVMTPGAVASKVVDMEWDAARRKGVCIFPVIASDKLPWNAMPIWMQKGHCYDLTCEADKLINDLNTRCQQTRVPFMVDDLPSNHVERTRLFNQLIGMLIDDVSGNPKAITAALRGAGGFGKTTMAKALCHDIRTRYVFYDGILWVTIGEDPDNLIPKIEDLIYELSYERPGYADEKRASMHLHTLLEKKNVLIVIDDVWRQSDARPFLRGGPGCAWLLTTRNRKTLPPNCEEINVDEMEGDEAVQLLGAGLPIGQKRAVFMDLARRLGEWPLLLNLVNGVLTDRVLRHGQLLADALTDVEEMFEMEGLAAFDLRDEEARDLAVAKTMGVSLNRLDNEALRRFEELVVFPENLQIPVRTVATLWARNRADDPKELYWARKQCERFFDLSLLLEYNLSEKGKETIRLHDVVRAYLRGRVGMERARDLNGMLVDVHGYADPSLMPSDEPYLWRYLAIHLAGAGRTEALRALLMRFGWIRAKLAATNVLSLLDDYRHIENEADTSAVSRALRLSAHVLVTDKAQLADQLYGRLLPLESEGVQALAVGIPEAQTAPWLRTMHPALTPPGGSEFQRLEGHQGWVEAVAITPDGRWAVSGSQDQTLTVWDLQTGQEKHALYGHQLAVTAVAITADGRWAVSGSRDQALKVWNLETGQVQHTLVGHRSAVTAVAITPDGQWAVSGSIDQTLKVWNLEMGQVQRTLEGQQIEENAITITPDGRRTISGSEDEMLTVWDLETGKVQHALYGHQLAVTAVAITADGRRAISGSAGKTLRVWDLQTGKAQHTLVGHQSEVTAVAITPDGRRAVSGSRDQALKVWNLKTGQVQHTLVGHRSAVTAVAITADGRRAISGSEDQALKVWDLETGQVQRTLEGHQSEVTAVAITPDGRQVISGSADKMLKVWNLEMGQVQRSFKGHQGWVYAVAITPDGRRAVSGSRDQTLKVWDLQTGKAQHTLEGHQSEVTAVAVTPDGRQAISGSADKTLKVWDLETGQVQRTLVGHYYWVHGVAITADGQRVISGSWDHRLKVWDLQTGQEQHTLVGHQGWVYAVAVTPDGRRAVSGSRDQTLKVWDLQTGQEQHTLEGHRSTVTAVAITPDGRQAISGSGDQMLKVWDLETGQEQHTLEGHQGTVTAVAITPDGRQVISGSWDHRLKVWDLQTGVLICTFTCEGIMPCTAVAPDGRTVVAGDAGGQLYFLRLENG